MAQVRELADPAAAYHSAVAMLSRMAAHGADSETFAHYTSLSHFAAS